MCYLSLDLRLLITPLASSKSKDRQCNGLELEDTKGVIRSRKSKKDRQCNALELEDNKGVIRSRKSKDRQYNGLELEDTKGVIRSRKSKKDRQYNDLQNTTQKSEDRATRVPLKQGLNRGGTLVLFLLQIQ